jgi:endonuclease/exonuclease/phosphatase family metal-dependent hydrolase
MRSSTALASWRRVIRRLAWAALVAIGCGDGAATADAVDGGPAAGGSPDGATPADLVLLQANVGNISLDCLAYSFNLCSTLVEARLRASIAGHDPDVVVLQEVTSKPQCDALDEPHRERACHQAVVADQPWQIRRLVGDDFTIACEPRRGFECVAVHRRFGAIEGCADGALCDGLAEPTEPGPGCDGGFTISAVTVRPVAAAPFRLINGHPDSSSAACREHALDQVFGGAAALAPAGQPSLIAGDLNLDPFHDDDPSVALWRQHVGDGRRFRYHSGPAEAEPPYPTAFSLLGGRVLDHVVSDFAVGRCVTLGEAPGTVRLDDGSGTDHRALRCDLARRPEYRRDR